MSTPTPPYVFWLRRAGVFAVICGLGLLAAIPFVTPGSDVAGTVATPPPAVGNPIVAENRLPGDDDWHITEYAGRDLEGYVDRTSVEPGETLTLRASSTHPSFRVDVYRMGFYGGDGARKVWTRERVRADEQPVPTPAPRTNMVEADWEPTLRFEITEDWTTGAYLIRLTAADGTASFVPFTVREPRSRRAPILVQASVTTWQAYNDWGGHSLYHGRTSSGAISGEERASVVSFDRPYAFGTGTGDFLGEYPLIRFVEEHGYDVAYVTNIDTHADEDLLSDRRAFLSLTHDEYWSTQMRESVEGAIDEGVNFAFFGANAIFRKIRLVSSPLGPHRRQVNWRAVRPDDVARDDPNAATVSWRQPPISEPEDEILGAMYECNPVSGDLIVYDAMDWLFEGTGLEQGDVVEGILGSEYDRVFDEGRHPEPLWVLFRSPVRCRGMRSVSDTTFARFPSGAAVFNAATSRFLCVFLGCPDAPPDERVQRLVKNLLDSFLSSEEVFEPTPRPFEVDRPRFEGQDERQVRRPVTTTRPSPTPDLSHLPGHPDSPDRPDEDNPFRTPRPPQVPSQATPTPEPAPTTAPTSEPAPTSSPAG